MKSLDAILGPPFSPAFIFEYFPLRMGQELQYKKKYNIKINAMGP